jgi:hypothetical protein
MAKSFEVVTALARRHNLAVRFAADDALTPAV